MTKSNGFLRSFFELSFNLAYADFKIKNYGTLLGVFWYLLSPLLTFLLLLLIFKDRLGSDIPLYSGYLLIGIIMFNFFEKATLDAIRTIRDNEGLIKSINFNREALILSIVLKNMFSHIFEIALAILFFIIFSLPLKMFVFYLMILIFFILFIYGCALIVSVISIYVKDIGNMWFFFLKLLWLGTPIFYAIEAQGRLLFVNHFNPLYYFINLSRGIILYDSLILKDALIVVIFSLAFIVIGKLIFSKNTKKLGELV